MTLLVQDLPTLRVPTALDQRQRTGATPLLVLALVLRPGEFGGNVDHVIPRVVDADEQEQHRSRGDDEQCRCRMAWEQHRRDEEGSVGDQRKDRMPQPVFQSACQGALRIAATSSARQKCMTLGVLKVANASLGDDTRTRTPAIKVATTNIKPVSVAAAEPIMT